MEGSIGPHSNILLMTKVSRKFLEINLFFAIIMCVCMCVCVCVCVCVCTHIYTDLRVLFFSLSSG